MEEIARDLGIKLVFMKRISKESIFSRIILGTFYQKHHRYFLSKTSLVHFIKKHSFFAMMKKTPIPALPL